MKYAYIVQTPSPSNCLVEIIFDRILFNGEFSHFTSFKLTPNVATKFLSETIALEYVSGDFIKVCGNVLKVYVNHFKVAKAIKNIVQKVQREFAPSESVQRVSFEQVKSSALSLNISPEIQAANFMVEAAKIFPNQDPIRLASAIKDLNLPITQALIVFRKLAEAHPREDAIRLVAGYNTMLGMTKTA